MDLKDFEIDANGCEFEVFAVYNVFSESGAWKEFQTHLTTVKIDTDILHDRRYSVGFEPNKSKYIILFSVLSTKYTMTHQFSILFEYTIIKYKVMQDSMASKLNYNYQVLHR